MTVPVCQCTDICVIPQGQPQPIASCRGLERQATEQRERDAYCVGQRVGWDNAATQLENWGSRGEAIALRRLAAHQKGGDSEMTPTPELMARATQAVLAIIGVDDRAGAMQAVVSPATHQMAADIARAVIGAIR